MKQVNRREVIKTGAACLASVGAGRLNHVAATNQARPVLYRAAGAIEAPAAVLPAGQSLPFGWGGFAIPLAAHGGAAVLRWERGAGDKGDARFRFTVAVDVRDRNQVEVFLPRSGVALGNFAVDYATVFQVFELLVKEPQVEAVFDEGLGLRLGAGERPLWVFGARTSSLAAAAAGGQPIDRALTPHLLFASNTDPLSKFYDRMFSLASVQMFGWMEGCVLDGLTDSQNLFKGARARSAVEQHLMLFFDRQENFVYESPRSVRVTNSVYGIEGLLPFATLARRAPRHRALKVALDFCSARAKADGIIQDGNHLSTEGSYTVGYPLAVMSRIYRRGDLAELCARQLRGRLAALVTDEAILQSRNADGRGTGHRNWARGVAWHMLGLARCLPLLEGSVAVTDLKAEFRRVARWALSYQRPDGLWSCFIDDATTLVDTSGSAGIAAALAIGARDKLLPGSFRRAAMKAKRGLIPHLTPDGFLSGVAQANKGGAALQRSDYRVNAQFAMGLMAQLLAALGANR